MSCFIYKRGSTIYPKHTKRDTIQQEHTVKLRFKMQNKKKILTKLGARLELIRTMSGKNYNWVFIPAFGLSSDSLSELTKCLHLPGSMWYFTFPGTETKTTKIETNFLKWPNVIIEVTQILDNVILVAHSQSAMYLLTIPDLEQYLTGIALMGAAPNIYYIKEVEKYIKKHPLPEADRLAEVYERNKNNRNLKKLIIASAPYCFTKKGLKKGLSFLGSITCNYKVEEYVSKNFVPHYKARWIPKHIAALIFTGNNDYITPLRFFEKSPEYQRPNILLKKIKNAAHYPWIENPTEVANAFAEYIDFLTSPKVNCHHTTNA